MMRFIIIALMFCAMLMQAAYVHAARGKREVEPRWRVSNDATPEIVPLYAGSVTPFPVREAPPEKKKVAVQVEEKKAVSVSQRQEFYAAEILGKIRKMLMQDDIFNPDIGAVVVDAILTGSTSGSAALIQNTWLREGDALDVPVVAAGQLFSLISDLKDLNPKLASIMEEQVSERVSQAARFSLEIVRIEKSLVELRDEKGQLHVINFVHSSW